MATVSRPSAAGNLAVERTLVLGYGNLDRQDDGVAWHVLAGLAKRLGRRPPATLEDAFSPADGAPDLSFDLQLMPEFAETIAGYKRACFVDAHTGTIPEAIRMSEIQPEFNHSPFTHHMTPPACLALAQTLYGSSPEAILVSVRGHAFGFTRSLSAPTRELAEQAVDRIYAWLFR